MLRRAPGILSIFGLARDLRSLKLHVVPGCRFLPHESLNHDVTQDSTRRVLPFWRTILDQIGNQRRFVWSI